MPRVTPTMNTRAAWRRAKAVRNFTKYSMSAFSVEDVLPTMPLGKEESDSGEGGRV